MNRVMCLFLCLAFVLLASESFVPATDAAAIVPSAAPPPSSATTDIEEEVYQTINRFRAENHLAPLAVTKDLSQVARSHSQDMAARDYFDHVSPDGDNVRKRVTRGGITNWDRLAENIAMNYGHMDPAWVAVRGWMESPPHRQNILDKDLTETGIGVAVDAKGRVYVTQLFVRRK
jgi:uncharacterized protein YkwD